jgi:CBS domain-containing protein
MRMTVAGLMTQRPVIVSPDCSAHDAVEILSRRQTSELYVVDPVGRLLGIVPDFELVKAELSGEAHGATVENLMSRNVPVFRPDTDAAEVARLFCDGRFSRFPVVAKGRLVGVITRADVVRLMAVLRRIDAPLTVGENSTIKAPKSLVAATRTRRSKPSVGISVVPKPRRRSAGVVSRKTRG